jgi:hypothetical protein
MYRAGIVRFVSCFGADTECLVRFSNSILRENFRNLRPRTLRCMDVSFPTSDLERARNRVLFLSTLAFTLLFAVWLMLGVLAVAIREELRLTAVEFSWLTASAVLTGSLLRLPFGVLTDRFGGRTMMTASLLIESTLLPGRSRVLSGTAWPAMRLPWASPGTQPGSRASVRV